MLLRLPGARHHAQARSSRSSTTKASQPPCGMRCPCAAPLRPAGSALVQRTAVFAPWGLFGSRRLGQRHQLQVLAPPEAPSAAPFGSDDLIVESTGDIVNLTYAYAYEALEESLEQVKILTVLIDSLEGRLESQIKATKDLYAWGLDDTFKARINDHIEHLKTQLGAAQSQLSAATARVESLEEIADRERDTVVHIETMARNLNWNIYGLREIEGLADRWQIAVSGEPAVRALQRDAMEKSTKLAELERLRRIVEAELSDAKLTLAIAKHRASAVENRPAMVPVAEAAVERAVEAVEGKADEYEEVMSNLKEAEDVAREATSKYNKEVRQLRWNLQAAVQCARDMYDNVQDELIGLQDHMEEIVDGIEEAQEMEADLYAEQERIERQILMNEDAKAEMEAKRAMRRAKRDSGENWRGVFDEVVTASMEEDDWRDHSSSEDDDDYGDPAPVGNWRMALKRLQNRPPTPGGGDHPRSPPPSAGGPSAGAATATAAPPQQDTYRPAQASVPLLDSAIQQQTGTTSSSPDGQLPTDILAQMDAARREGAIIHGTPPPAFDYTQQDDLVDEEEEYYEEEDVDNNNNHHGLYAADNTVQYEEQQQEEEQGGEQTDYLEAARQALLKKAGLNLQGRVGGAEVDTSMPSLSVATDTELDLEDDQDEEGVMLEGEEDDEDVGSSMFETVDLEDPDAHLEDDFQARLLEVQRRAEEAGRGKPPATLQQAPWPAPQAPPGAAPGTLLLCSAAHSLPHPDKRHKGGEDAFFVSNSGCGALGVADGVGGWIEDGIDPGDYSRHLMQTVLQTLQALDPQSEASPVDLMQLAQDETHHAGSSTACVGVLHQDGVLRVANLGDSGIKVIRDGEIFFASQSQQHAFNMPFQLANPDLLPDTDTAQDADMYEIPLEEGDVVILATDGLFDNLWDEQLLELVDEALQGGNRQDAAAAEDLATMLATVSHDNALDRNFKSPWAVEAAAAGVLPANERMMPRGGKLDDCTVVVSIVQAL